MKYAVFLTKMIRLTIDADSPDEALLQALEQDDKGNYLLMWTDVPSLGECLGELREDEGLVFDNEDNDMDKGVLR